MMRNCIKQYTYLKNNCLIWVRSCISWYSGHHFYYDTHGSSQQKLWVCPFFSWVLLVCFETSSKCCTGFECFVVLVNSSSQNYVLWLFFSRLFYLTLNLPKVCIALSVFKSTLQHIRFYAPLLESVWTVDFWGVL